jgi:hypothetical protein
VATSPLLQDSSRRGPPLGGYRTFSRGNWLLTDSPGAEQLLQQLLEVGTLPQRVEVAVLLHVGDILESLSHCVAEQLHRLVAVELHRRLPLVDVGSVVSSKGSVEAEAYSLGAAVTDSFKTTIAGEAGPCDSLRSVGLKRCRNR